MIAAGAWHATLPADLVVGPGARRELGRFLGAGTRVVAVVSRSTAPLVADLLPDGVLLRGRAVVVGEPTIDRIVPLVRHLRVVAPDVLVAVGGGSVIDTAKALAAFATNHEHPPRGYLEVVGDGHPLTVDPLPVLALPTTAGTGSEATHNAVLGVPEAGRKVSLRDRRLTPRAALVDPELGAGVPHAVAVSSGLDAAVQLVEAAATPLGTPFTTAVTLDGARALLPALARLVAGEAGADDRTALSYGALCSGIALANAKLGTIHGVAGVLGGLRPLSHGVLCGRYAAPVLRATAEQLRRNQPPAGSPEAHALERYAALAQLATGQPGGPEELAAWFAGLVADADLPTVDLEGLDLEQVVAAVGQASSTRGNPVIIAPDRLAAAVREGAG